MVTNNGTPPVPENNRQDNLARLCREIQGMHGGLLSPADSPRNKLCRRLADNMPLSHATGADTFAKICQSGALLSLTRLDTVAPLDWSSHPVETQLETRDCVFLFAGSFRYPDTSCGFLFRPDLAETHTADGAATPFDSGGLVNNHRPPGGEAPLDFLRRHEMPVPQYRRYHLLVLDLLFDDPWHYVDGVNPIRQGPVQLAAAQSDARRWTFEVRLMDELPIRSNLQAVFSPLFASESDSVPETLYRYRTEGVDIIEYPGLRGSDEFNFELMKRKCEAYIRSIL
jgi:hypothetical protein